MIGRKIVKVAALVIIAVVSYFMVEWFGVKAFVGIMLAISSFGLYAAVSHAEAEERLVENTIDETIDMFDMLCSAAEENGDETITFEEDELKRSIKANVLRGECEEE